MSHRSLNTQNSSIGGDQSSLVYSSVNVYQLQAGTLEKIVECLTNDEGDLDTMHMHILFATYRTYTDISTLVKTIVARYRKILPASLDLTEGARKETLK